MQDYQLDQWFVDYRVRFHTLDGQTQAKQRVLPQCVFTAAASVALRSGTMAPKRSPTSPDAMAQLSALIVETATTPSFFKYGEAMDKSSPNPQALLSISAFWQKLVKIHPTLNFNQSYLVETFQKAYLDLKDKWSRTMTDDEIKHWSETMSKRIRTACRHINNTRNKHGSCGWLDRLFAKHIDDGISEPAAKKNKTSPEPIQYLYGFDYELLQAWRAHPDSTKKDFSPIVLQESFEHPIAYFPDCVDPIEIKTVSKDEAKHMLDSKARRASCWETTMGRDIKLRVQR